ncbi:hypothetical protein ACFYPC_11190 [Streptomyces sp. NPDC005808]|uniref:hypothetical protein n=1 Tax=Streptomyces sp. NPDC005808 TaxID=3364734 RepID=UPI0036BB782D
MTQPRFLGLDAETGKRMYAVPQPGGFLDHLADVTALEAATAFLAVVGEVLDSEDELSDGELAVFLAPAVAMLTEVMAIAVKRVDVRYLGQSLRASQRS